MLHGMGIAITTTRHLQAGGGDGHALLPSSPFTSLASVSLKAGISPAPILITPSAALAGVESLCFFINPIVYHAGELLVTAR